MFSSPDVDEVTGVARTLGIDLSREEAEFFRQHVIRQLQVLDRFVQSRVDEGSPPVVYPARAVGGRPSDAEDPLGAWLWKCKIGGCPDGPLSGKTVSFKDNVAVAGVPLTYGSFSLEGFVADFDATIATRVLEAGGTIIGKNTMSGLSGGFAFGGGIGDYARPKNPHALGRAAGGSSSGCAVAVAAREVDIAFGGDQGGSLRIPAALSGTLGLKPTHGLVSHFGIGFGVDPSLDHTGPMTLTVEDAAAALQAVAGFDGLDPRQDRRVPDRIDALTGLDRGVSGLRIGLLEESFTQTEPEVREIVMAGVEVLAQAGAIVSTVSVPAHLTVSVPARALMAESALALFNTGILGAFAKTYYPTNLIATVNRMWRTRANLLGPRNKLRLLVGEFSRRNFDGRVYGKAQNVRPSFVRAFDQALVDVDVLVTPTCNETAPELADSTDTFADFEADIAIAAPVAANTVPFNYTGHPALAVPCGKAGGLPVSMQLVGRFFEDPLLLQVAYAFQHSVDWNAITSVEPV